MNFDQRVHDAAKEANEAAEATPDVPVEKLAARRLARLAAPILGLGIAVWVVVVLLVSPSGETPPGDSVVPTPTTVPQVTTSMPQVAPPLDALWVRGSSTRILDDQGSILYEYPSTVLNGRNTAWDGIDGFVALTESGVIWMRPQGQVTVDAPFGSIVDVGFSETATRVVGIDPFDSDDVVWLDLESGDSTGPPSDSKTLDGVSFTVGDRMATIETPDWSDAEVDEIGQPLPPFDLPTLVVTEDGEEVLRIEVGGEQLPFVNIHDFDGRRLIIGAEPFEPASPPVTAWIIDLECAACTQRVNADSLEYFDLIGVLPPEGPVVTPDLP